MGQNFVFLDCELPPPIVEVWRYRFECLIGHTHDCFDYRVSETRVVCNPKGYGPMRPGRWSENVLFDAGFMVEV